LLVSSLVLPRPIKDNAPVPPPTVPKISPPAEEGRMVNDDAYHTGNNKETITYNTETAMKLINRNRLLFQRT
jgi:hypothetical protein